MRLEDDELRDVLSRAQEIERYALDGGAMQAELELVMQAAEEVGISRGAVERALRERLDLPRASTAVGDLVFARSADGKFYAAEIVDAEPDGLRVRFLSGGGDSLTLDALRPCSFRPGERIMVHWPWWGVCKCTVVRYDASTQRVTVDDGWGETRAFPIAEVWLDSPRRTSLGKLARTRMHVTLLSAGAVVGAVLGSAVTVLLLR